MRYLKDLVKAENVDIKDKDFICCELYSFVGDKHILVKKNYLSPDGILRVIDVYVSLEISDRINYYKLPDIKEITIEDRVYYVLYFIVATIMEEDIKEFVLGVYKDEETAKEKRDTLLGRYVQDLNKELEI